MRGDDGALGRTDDGGRGKKKTWCLLLLLAGGSRISFFPFFLPFLFIYFRIAKVRHDPREPRTMIVTPSRMTNKSPPATTPQPQHHHEV